MRACIDHCQVRVFWRYLDAFFFCKNTGNTRGACRHGPLTSRGTVSDLDVLGPPLSNLLSILSPNSPYFRTKHADLLLQSLALGVSRHHSLPLTILGGRPMPASASPFSLPPFAI